MLHPLKQANRHCSWSCQRYQRFWGIHSGKTEQVRRHFGQ
jgi:hypothetical protein